MNSRGQARRRGTARHTRALLIGLIGTVGVPGLAMAQAESEEVVPPPPGLTEPRPVDLPEETAEIAPDAPTTTTEPATTEPATTASTAPAPAAQALDVPEPPSASASPPLDPERPPAYGTWPSTTEPEPAGETRPADWRYPRQLTLRPLTLPQGALRFDSTVSLGGRGSVRFSGMAGFAAGLHDDFELGATPLSVSWVLGAAISGPEVYARLRALSGEVQLAFRANGVIPLGESDPQWGATAELAWTPLSWFRIDAALDYQMLLAQVRTFPPGAREAVTNTVVHQRVGIPVAATFSARGQSFTLTTGAYVFNDGDDWDLPILLRYTGAFGGHRGPIAQFSLEGGFADVTAGGGPSWVIRHVWTWFAYL